MTGAARVAPPALGKVTGLQSMHKLTQSPLMHGPSLVLAQPVCLSARNSLLNKVEFLGAYSPKVVTNEIAISVIIM